MYFKVLFIVVAGKLPGLKPNLDGFEIIIRLKVMDRYRLLSYFFI